MNLIGMLSVDELFKGRHFDREIIVLCVRWYLRYKLSFRDLVEMMAERGFCCKLCCWRTSRMIGGNDRAGVSMGLGNCFKGRQLTAEAILWAVRWYLMFPVSYRDLELMLLDRGVEVDHTKIFRWIQAYAAELEKRTRPHLRMSNGSWRVDETYIRVKGRWTYLYRAVDSRGQTIDFLLSARRDTAARTDGSVIDKEDRHQAPVFEGGDVDEGAGAPRLQAVRGIGRPLVFLDIIDSDELAAFQAINERTIGAQGKNASKRLDAWGDPVAPDFERFRVGVYRAIADPADPKRSTKYFGSRERNVVRIG